MVGNCKQKAPFVSKQTPIMTREAPKHNCEQESSIVSRKLPIVSKKLHPCFVGRKAREITIKPRSVLFAEPFQSSAKKGKRQKAARKIAERKSQRKSKKARVGGSGWGQVCPSELRVREGILLEKKSFQKGPFSGDS